jgi:hypothetical protein
VAAQTLAVELKVARMSVGAGAAVTAVSAVLVTVKVIPFTVAVVVAVKLTWGALRIAPAFGLPMEIEIGGAFETLTATATLSMFLVVTPSPGRRAINE